MDSLTQPNTPSIKPLSGWTMVVSLVLWLASWIGAAAIVVALNFRNAEQDLTQYGDAYSDHLNRAMISSETVLKGFSALFGAVGNTNPAKVSRYVRQVIESNPQIFSLEIAQRVPIQQLAEFVAGERRQGIPNFTVKSFSFDSDRKWQPLEVKPFYYPIVFMEPRPVGSEKIRGLDLDSVPFLQRAMRESLQSHAQVASRPFKLVEGNLAFVVFSPIYQAFQHEGTAGAFTPNYDQMVDMVIDAAKLTAPIKQVIFDGGKVHVYHKDFSPDDSKGQLLALSGAVRSPLETALFPNFVYKTSLATKGSPFTLMVKRQVGWSDLSLGLLAVLAVLACMSSLLLMAYLRKYRLGQELQVTHQKQLLRLANHDALTGLPNRLLLMDRMKQSLARTLRQGKRIAVMFLDLDNFKQVNDLYGHDAGDQLLKDVAERLREAVRIDDTVARLSGDEFIILIEHFGDLEALETVRQKIQKTLSEGLLIKGHPLSFQVSIGLALFPGDGDSPEDLIRQADARMYAEKQSRKSVLQRA